jgi:hypothetical protein
LIPKSNDKVALEEFNRGGWDIQLNSCVLMRPVPGFWDDDIKLSGAEFTNVDPLEPGELVVERPSVTPPKNVCGGWKLFVVCSFANAASVSPWRKSTFKFCTSAEEFIENGGPTIASDKKDGPVGVVASNDGSR